MDISKKLKEMVENNLENDKLVKHNRESLEKQYDLQKSLKHLETSLSIMKDEFDEVKNKVILLTCELPGWQEKADIAKNTFESLVYQFVEQEENTSKMQSELWKSINDWVESSSQHFQKKNIIKTRVDKDSESDENEKDEKRRQLKLEGQLQALRAYEKYQIRKIKEIEKINELLHKVDNLPFFV